MALSLSPIEIVRRGEYQLLTKAEHWERVRLGDVANVQNGFPFKSELFDREEGVPLIRIRDVNSSTTEHRYKGEYDPAYIVRRGEIIIGMDGDFKADNVLFEGGAGETIRRKAVRTSDRFSGPLCLRDSHPAPRDPEPRHRQPAFQRLGPHIPRPGRHRRRYRQAGPPRENVDSYRRRAAVDRTTVVADAAATATRDNLADNITEEQTA